MKEDKTPAKARGTLGDARDAMIARVYSKDMVPWLITGFKKEEGRAAIVSFFSQGALELENEAWKLFVENIKSAIKQAEFERYKEKHHEDN